MDAASTTSGGRERGPRGPAGERCAITTSSRDLADSATTSKYSHSATTSRYPDSATVPKYHDPVDVVASPRRRLTAAGRVGTARRAGDVL